MPHKITPTLASAHRPPVRARKRGWLSRNGSFHGFQARIKIRGVETSRLFSDSLYDGMEGARKAGQAWLDAITQELPTRYQANLHRRARPGKRDGLPAGVCRTTALLRSGAVQERFQVLWHDGDRPRNKSFTVGTPDTATARRRRRAKAAALAFRAAYVECRTAGRVFKPTAAMLNWSARNG